jgi:hypothetical protein
LRLLRGRKTVRADRRLRTDEKHIRAQSAVLDKTPTPSLLLTITVFFARMRFSSAQKTRLARAARRFCENLRGRKTVRADRRLRTDEKHIRAQSAILDKSDPKALLLSFKTVCLVRMCLLSVPNKRLARESA